MFAISTEAVPASDRIEFWSDLVERQVAPLRFESIGNCPFRSEMRVQMIGELSIAEFAGAGVRVSRTRSEIARTVNDRYVLSVNVRGTARISRAGESRILQQADVFIDDTTQEFTLDLMPPWRHLLIMLPEHWVKSRVVRPELLASRVLANHPLCRLLAGYLTNGFQLADQLSLAASEMFAQHMLDLLEQTLQETRPVQPTPLEAWRAAMFLRACRLIAARHADPELAPDQVAAQMHISRRTLERIFAEHGETPMRRLWNERVDRAAKNLVEPAAAGKSITEIAFACGFNDSAHFTRTFVARMHMTPSQWRSRTG